MHTVYNCMQTENIFHSSDINLVAQVQNIYSDKVLYEVYGIARTALFVYKSTNSGLLVSPASSSYTKHVHEGVWASLLRIACWQAQVA